MTRTLETDIEKLQAYHAKYGYFIIGNFIKKLSIIYTVLILKTGDLKLPYKCVEKTTEEEFLKMVHEIGWDLDEEYMKERVSLPYYWKVQIVD